MGDKKINDYMEYQTWVVSKTDPETKRCFLYLPDFVDAPPIPVKATKTEDSKLATGYGKARYFIIDCMKKDGFLKPKMPQDVIEDIYGECKKEIISFNILELFDKAYREDNQLALPPMQEILRLNAHNKSQDNNKLFPNFWVALFEATDNDLSTDKIYEIHFPEIHSETNAYYPITVKQGEDLHDIIEEKLFRVLSDYIDIDDVPEKWPQSKVTTWSNNPITDDLFAEERLFEINLSEDHFFALNRKVKALNRFKNNTSNNILNKHWPRDDIHRKWPPGDKPPQP